MFHESVSKDSSNNIIVCGGNAGVMFGRKLQCFHQNGSTCCARVGGGAKGAIRATTTQRLRAQAVERTARVMAARDRAMTFWISSLHLDVKDCALACCPLPRASISAASLTVLTAGGNGRPYIVRLGDISFRFDITDLKVTTNIMRAATCPRTGRDSGDSEYASQSCYYRRELIECR